MSLPGLTRARISFAWRCEDVTQELPQLAAESLVGVVVRAMSLTLRGVAAVRPWWESCSGHRGENYLPWQGGGARPWRTAHCDRSARDDRPHIGLGTRRCLLDEAIHAHETWGEGQ